MIYKTIIERTFIPMIKVIPNFLFVVYFNSNTTLQSFIYACNKDDTQFF